MHAILARRDSVVVLPTGGGKSLCFQAPALVEGPAEAGHYSGSDRRGFALVVSPLISLMKDQVDGLRVDGVAAAYLNSTLNSAERDEVVASLRDDRCRLLYVSPERLVGDGSQGFRRMLRADGRALHRDRRSALHQPVGARLPSGVPAARAPARRFSRRVAARVHGDGHRARPTGHRGGAAARASAGPRRIVRSPQPDVSRAPPRRSRSASCCRCSRGTTARPASSTVRRGGRWNRWPRGSSTRGTRRCPITPASATRCAAATRSSSSTSAPTSSSRRWRSGWESTDRTCATSCTRERRGRRSITSRSRAARAATACPPSACSCIRDRTSCAGGRCSNRTAS